MKRFTGKGTNQFTFPILTFTLLLEMARSSWTPQQISRHLFFLCVFGVIFPPSPLLSYVTSAVHRQSSRKGNRFASISSVRYFSHFEIVHNILIRLLASVTTCKCLKPTFSPTTLTAPCITNKQYSLYYFYSRRENSESVNVPLICTVEQSYRLPQASYVTAARGGVLNERNEGEAFGWNETPILRVLISLWELSARQ